ncbi:unnamed protein product [Symbiodinium sp. CCMP2592]|nr:unnamed protein product [Symbiodinium sp. CCMP2592]
MLDQSVEPFMHCSGLSGGLLHANVQSNGAITLRLRRLVNHAVFAQLVFQLTGGCRAAQVCFEALGESSHAVHMQKSTTSCELGHVLLCPYDGNDVSSYECDVRGLRRR